MSCSEAAAKKIPEHAQARDETAETFPRNELSALVNHMNQDINTTEPTANQPCEEVAILGVG